MFSATHDYRDIPAEEPKPVQTVLIKPVYDPDKTAFLRWQAHFLDLEKNALKELKGKLQVGLIYRPDLDPDKNQRYLMSVLFISGLTLYVCLSVIIRLYSHLFLGKIKPEFLTKNEIGLTFGCLFAFLYLLNINLKDRRLYSEKKITENEAAIIFTHCSAHNNLTLNNQVILKMSQNITVSDLMQFIDQQLLPKITLISNELTKSVNHPEMILSTAAIKIQERWLTLYASEKLKWRESPLEQTFSANQFAMTGKY
jgi:hypothetical protein